MSTTDLRIALEVSVDGGATAASSVVSLRLDYPLEGIVRNREHYEEVAKTTGLLVVEALRRCARTLRKFKQPPLKQKPKKRLLSPVQVRAAQRLARF